MGDLIPLDKKETLRMEDETTNLCSSIKGQKIYRDNFELWMDLLGWYHAHGLTTSDPLKKHIALFSKLIGCAPQYHAIRGSERNRTAVWGFKYNQSYLIIYLNLRGLDMQFFPEIGSGDVVGILDTLKSKLLSK